MKRISNFVKGAMLPIFLFFVNATAQAQTDVAAEESISFGAVICIVLVIAFLGACFYWLFHKPRPMGPMGRNTVEETRTTLRSTNRS